jgi:hypothetical protein
MAECILAEGRLDCDVVRDLRKGTIDEPTHLAAKGPVGGFCSVASEIG